VWGGYKCELGTHMIKSGLKTHWALTCCLSLVATHCELKEAWKTRMVILAPHMIATLFSILRQPRLGKLLAYPCSRELAFSL
jgi:hypothetical protein